jgi:hypothetical protein
MAVFTCDRCGKCCVSLGSHIRIERQLSDRDYYCRSNLDSEIVPVQVEPAYRDEIADEFETEELSGSLPGMKACPFVRNNREGEKTACAMYATRPRVCRDFCCYHTLIHNPAGIACGRVIGKNTLRTDDAALEKIWNMQVVALPYNDLFAWRHQVARILAVHGYRTDPAD